MNFPYKCIFILTPRRGSWRSLTMRGLLPPTPWGRPPRGARLVRSPHRLARPGNVKEVVA
eukprot:547212-Prorocentrum_minimum.AAC.1